MKYMRYIVYKASGGLTHMLRGLTHAIQFAIKNSRYLIVDTEQHNGSLMKFGTFFRIEGVEYSDSYDTISNNLKYKDLTIEQLKNAGVQCNGGPYSLNITPKYYIHSVRENGDDIVVYCNCFGSDNLVGKHIKVQQNIMEKIKTYNIQDNYIGVHFRNTDLKNNVGNFTKQIKNLSNKTKIQKVYLATDDFQAYDKFKQSLPNFEIVTFTKPYSDNGKPVKTTHYSNPDKYNQIFGTLLDIYFLVKATEFIPSNNSGMSKWIKIMRSSGETIFD